MYGRGRGRRSVRGKRENSWHGNRSGRRDTHERIEKSGRNDWRRRMSRERNWTPGRVALLSHTPPLPPRAAVAVDDVADVAASLLDTPAVLCCFRCCMRRRSRGATHTNAIASAHSCLSCCCRHCCRPVAAHSWLALRTTVADAARAVPASSVQHLAGQAPQGVESASQQKERKTQQRGQQLQAQQQPYDWWQIEMD